MAAGCVYSTPHLTTMPRSTIHETITICAPIERCWLLSTRIELVQKTLGMTPVAGVTRGFIRAGSRVTWSGWKFGLPTRHYTVITRFEQPHIASAQPFARADMNETTKEAFFQDKQEKGRFASFHHNHFFREEIVKGEAFGNEKTVLTDEVHFRLPLGFLGEMVAKYVMQSYIRKLTQQRFAMIKKLAEGAGWREWI